MPQILKIINLYFLYKHTVLFSNLENKKSENISHQSLKLIVMAVYDEDGPCRNVRLSAQGIFFHVCKTCEV